MRLFWIACLLLPTAAFAASNVCEPNPQVEKAFVQNDLWNDYLEDFPREKPILARLLEKYANDVQLNRRNILVARNGIKAERYAAIEKYRLAAEKDRRCNRNICMRSRSSIRIRRKPYTC